MPENFMNFFSISDMNLPWKMNDFHVKSSVNFTAIWVEPKGFHGQKIRHIGIIFHVRYFSCSTNLDMGLPWIFSVNVENAGKIIHAVTVISHEYVMTQPWSVYIVSPNVLSIHVQLGVKNSYFFLDFLLVGLS